MTEPFRILMTRDFLRPDGTPVFSDLDTSVLDDADGVDWDVLGEFEEEIQPTQIRDCDGLFIGSPRLSARSLQGAERLTVAARYGAGYDRVDVAACTERGVALTTAPGGVRRPVASSAMALILALAHRIPVKDRLTREGRWEERIDYTGVGLTGRVLGVVGMGNIGCELLRLARPFEMHHVAFDPYASAAAAQEVGAELVSLETAMKTADFLCVCCALTAETKGMIDGRLLEQMKTTAFFVNVARGPVVDQAALGAALQRRAIAGAGLDVFVEEPVDPEEPLLKLDNVIVTPHSIAWTDELNRGMGEIALQSLLDVSVGRPPENVVNRKVLRNHRFLERLKHYRTDVSERDRTQ